MKTKIMPVAMAAVIALWTTSGFSREAVVLPGVVGATGVLDGVDTIGPGTLTVGNQDINTNDDPGGGVTTSAANTANIVFSGNSTVTGFTGTPGATFLNINAGVNGATVTFNGDVYSTTFNVVGTGIVNFNGNVTGAPNFAADGFINLAASRTLTGAVITANANTGTFTFNGGSSVIGAMGGGNGLKQINVVGGNAAITGAVHALGFNLGANTLTITGALTTNAGGTIATTLLSDTVFGRINPSGISNINPAGITVIPTVTGVLTNGTNFRIVNGLAGTAGAPVLVINNNPRFTFTGVPTSTGDVNILLVEVLPLAALVTTPAAAAVGAVLDIPAAPGSDLLTVQDAIAVLPTTTAINNALLQLAPGTTQLAAPWVATQTTRLLDDMWMARVDEIQDMCCDATCASDKFNQPAKVQQCKTSPQRSNWWGKAFDSEGRQDDVNSMNGYKTQTAGLMLAHDTAINHQTRVGFGGSFATSTIDGNNNSGRTKVDSYQATGYVRHTMGSAFVLGAVTAGADRYSGTRSIVFPGINRTASADYSGQQYSGRVTVGQHFLFDAITVTPLASLRATRVRVNGYTESGAGDVNLRVNSQSYDFVQSSVGVKAERVIQSGRSTYAPEVHVNWMHDFRSTTMQQDTAFTGGGGVFTTQGIQQDRNLFNVGAGVTFLACNCERGWTVKGQYDYRWNKSNYSSNQLSVVASLKF